MWCCYCLQGCRCRDRKFYLYHIVTFSGRQKIVTYFLTAPPPSASSAHTSAVRCLLSHCCRQLAVCRQVSMVGLLCNLGHPHFYPHTHSNQHVGLQCTLALQHTTVKFCLGCVFDFFCLTPCSGLSTAAQPTPPTLV